MGPDDFRDGDESRSPPRPTTTSGRAIRGDYWNDPRVGATRDHDRGGERRMKSSRLAAHHGAAACAWVLVKSRPTTPMPPPAVADRRGGRHTQPRRDRDRCPLTNRVTDAEGWSAEGTWLVIDLDAASGARSG
ncbi:hypothetical protein JM654_20605 [Microbacterium oxydans]|nr:hypothetical protein [Microbacterium oxydans]